MKRITTFAAALCLTMGMSAQTITISSIDKTLANDYAGGCEIDLNNDGLKELIVSGYPHSDAAPGRIYEDENGDEQHSAFQSWVFTWNGSAYDHKEFAQLCGYRSHIIPADFNGDGYIDLYIAGEAYDHAGVYLNDGNGNFALDGRYKVTDSKGGTVDWYPRAADVADFNQDGLPDVVTIGWSSVGGNRQANCGVLINQGDGTFKNVLEQGIIGNGEVDFEMALCTVAAYDLNKDGYPDFLLQGNIDNQDGTQAITTAGNKVNRTFMALLNVGATNDGTTSFYSLEIGTGVSHQLGNGNIVVADFNNDGTPDIFVTGESPNDAFAAGVWNYFSQLLIGKVTKGEFNEVSYTDDNTYVARSMDTRPLNSNNMGIRAVDYDGDGYYDLFLDGWCERLIDGGSNTQAGWLLKGSDAGLTSYVRIPGASEQGIFFLDYGVQNALNYTFTGYHGDETYFSGNTGRSMVFTRNTSAVPSRPDAPTALNQNVDGSSVTLSWSPASSSKNNVTYEYYLKETTTGRLYNNVTSFVGGDKDGVRKVLRDGNNYMNTTLTLSNLADGTYEWGVQTINAAQMGSAFAKGGTFVIGTGTGVATPQQDAQAKEVARYNVNGQAVGSTHKGLNIVKMSNGQVKKVVVK